MAITEQIRDLRNEIAVERGRINSLWWKFGILAGVISAVASKVFGYAFGELINLITGW